MPIRLIAIMCLVLFSACSSTVQETGFRFELVGDVTARRDVPTSLYVGAVHRLNLLVPTGLDPAQIDVGRRAGSAGNVTLERRGDTRIDVLPTRVGEVVIELTSPAGEILGKSRFEVRRMPDPMARLNDSLGGSIEFQAFRDARSLQAVISGFPFDVECEITGFEIGYTQKRLDPVFVRNESGEFSSRTLSVTSRAKPGDVYTFTNVRAACPGDTDARPINSLAFFVR